MTPMIFLAIMFDLAWMDASVVAGPAQLNLPLRIAGIAQVNGPGLLHLLVMQDRIVLKRGEGGGVTIKPDPARVTPSYDHSSRPLFGTQTSYAAKRSTQRYTPPPPLITSRDVARESVRRSAYGRRWGW